MTTERAREMLATYGECVKTEQAAKIINCCRQTIYRMCLDGRLRKLPCGKVDVRSLAEWMERERQ